MEQRGKAQIIPASPRIELNQYFFSDECSYQWVDILILKGCQQIQSLLSRVTWN